ncbi:tRNA (5-methylaminomethyl-2-thiouridine)(34)-methyltransferase MnmD [Robiginitomaculum antarcticum]|uniref:tRNA (5-methylaminomethyl-2-thiouridine)(34)-methyltransferase MnmD n=1 Tax=Robiginitomaculum antarcticum TaxID=437507 RepID=UPI000372AFD7|nr:tRNA (5-methylaminomethyl-2-thiouridine)(34)-methyltransferase MnmD [Robiginitomaculum antarcticum]
MPELVPLTATPPAQLDFSRSGTLASTTFDDIYFSVDGGLEECRDVYLRGCGLPERWAGRDNFTIAELGFGTGLNFLATIEMWQAHRPSDTARLTYIAVEGFPLSKAELRKAYAHVKTLSPDVKRLHGLWPDRVKGVHVLDFDDVRLILIHDLVEQALEQIDFATDAWFLDGFTPSKNPDMWAQNVLKKVYALSAPGCRVGTFTVAGDVRRSLMNAGFSVSKQPGFGRKRERLEAVKAGETPAPKTAPRVAIIGGGIAGLMTALHLRAHGAQSVIYTDKGDSPASGNARAIVKPRLDILDRPESRFFNAAYLYAVRAYPAEFINDYGVYHIAKSDKERKRFEKLAGNQQLPMEHMKFIAAPDYSLDARFGALYFPQALVIDPASLTQSLMSEFENYESQVLNIHTTEDGVDLKFADGKSERFDHVVICAGQGVRHLLPDMDVRFQRGQITQVKTGAALDNAATYGGYAIPGQDAVWLGATHAPHESRDNAAILTSEDQENIDNYIARGGQGGEIVDHRASVRVTTPITLPIAGLLSEHIHIFSGLGGRGFVFAPLLGAHIAAKICGAPDVIAKDAAVLFKPRMKTP